MLQQVLEQCQCLGHLLAETRQVYIGCLRAYAHTPVATQLIELLAQVAGAELVGAQIAQVAGSHVVTVVGTLSEVIIEDEVEQAVSVVLHIIQWQLLLGLGDGEVLLEVDELRLDGLHLGVLDVLDERAHQVAVGRDGGDGRLVDLLLQAVDTLALEHGDIAIGEEAVGKGHQLRLGDL